MNAVGEAEFHAELRHGERLNEACDGAKRERALFFNALAFTDPTRKPHHRPDWHEPVRDTVNRVNVEHLAKERQSREQELRMSPSHEHRWVSVSLWRQPPCEAAGRSTSPGGWQDSRSFAQWRGEDRLRQ